MPANDEELHDAVSSGEIHVDIPTVNIDPSAIPSGGFDSAFGVSMSSGGEVKVQGPAEGVHVPDATPAEEPVNPYDLIGMSDADMPENLTPAQEAVLKLQSYGMGASGYHFKTDSGSARVDTDSIRKAAQDGKDIIDQIKELVTTMEAYVADSDAYWRGEAGDHFREGFAGGMKDLALCIDDHEEYIRELIAYADKYEGVITQANAIANALEDVVWGDV